MKTIRWGILGAGSIARKFATGLNDLPDTELRAVGSRTLAKADAFADEFGIPVRHDSYEALVNDADIDAIYVATPHSFHKEHSLLCMAQGKAVLCEKPFALNAQESQDMIDFARERKVFLMEAMWTKFLPHMVKLRELIAAGEIGSVRMLQADFGFRMGKVLPEHRLFDPALGGGALLDVGIYPVALAQQLFGAPTIIKSLANLGSTGVDEEASILLGHANGEQALLSTAIQVNTPHEAFVLGTEGRIRINAPWWAPSSLTLYKNGEEQPIAVDAPLNGYNYEALEVGRCLREGKLESDLVPLAETLSVMKTLDALRAQWGLSYPNESGVSA